MPSATDRQDAWSNPISPPTSPVGTWPLPFKFACVGGRHLCHHTVVPLLSTPEPLGNNSKNTYLYGEGRGPHSRDLGSLDPLSTLQDRVNHSLQGEMAFLRPLSPGLGVVPKLPAPCVRPYVMDLPCIPSSPSCPGGLASRRHPTRASSVPFTELLFTQTLKPEQSMAVESRPCV